MAGVPPGRTDALFAFDPAVQGLVLLDGQAETQTAPTRPHPPSRNTFAKIREEELRDFLLVTLNANFVGQGLFCEPPAR